MKTTRLLFFICFIVGSVLARLFNNGYYAGEFLVKKFSEKFSLTPIVNSRVLIDHLSSSLFSLITLLVHSPREDHPSYRSDTPHPITLRFIPFGLPRGGTSMRGMPFGLLAYAAKYGSWKAMLKQYRRHRMQERVFQSNYGRAYNSWSS